MGTLTPQNKNLAGDAFQLAFQDESYGEFQDSSLYIVFQYLQAFIQLIAKD
jgi:hypothetical protein